MESPPHPIPEPTSSPAAVDVSVGVCTFRRPQLLRACLDSLASQTNPFGAWDVVVVDNCPDKSAEATVCECGGRLAEHGIEVRYAAEPKSGVSHARNRGLAEARHPLVCFLDDDERAVSGWLATLLEPFATLGEAVDIVAGEVDPDFGDSSRPDWLADELLHMFSCRWGWDTKPRFLQEKEWFGEGNVAFRKRLFAGVGFDPALGRRGDALTSSEGVVFTLLRHQGARAFYAPDAKVSHFIHPERLSKKWLLRRQFLQGMSDCQAHRSIGKPPLVPRITIELHKILAVDLDTLSTEGLKTYCHVYHRLGYFVAATTT